MPDDSPDSSLVEDRVNLWLPVSGSEPADPARFRVDLVAAVERWTKYPLDGELLKIDEAVALLENIDGESGAREILADEVVVERLIELAEDLLGDPLGELSQATEYRRSSLLSRAIFADVAKVVAFASSVDGADNRLRMLDVELSDELAMRSRDRAASLEVVHATTVAERSGGNFKGTAEAVESGSVESAKDLLADSWARSRLAMSWMIADDVESGIDRFGWLDYSPAYLAGLARAQLSDSLVLGSSYAATLKVSIDTFIRNRAWNLAADPVGPTRPLISEYLFVLATREGA